MVRGKASPPDSFCLATRSQTCMTIQPSRPDGAYRGPWPLLDPSSPLPGFSVPQVPAPSLTCYIGEETKDNSDMAELFRRETTASQEEEEEEVDGEEVTKVRQYCSVSVCVCVCVCVCIWLFHTQGECPVCTCI